MLRGVERLRLCAAEILLPRDELALDRLDGLLLGAEFAAQGFELLLRLGEALGDGDVFLPRVTDAFLGLVDIAEGLRVLRLQLAEPLLVELDAMVVMLALAFEFEPLLARCVDFSVEVGEAMPKLLKLVLAAQDTLRKVFHLRTKLLALNRALGNLALQAIELMPRELRVEMLQLHRDLLVAAGLASLALERADLPLHLADEVIDAQQVLVGVLELAERLLLLRLELRDARRLLEHHAPVLGLALDDLRDVALRHDGVTGLPHPRAHEELLNVAQAARHLVDVILRAAVAEDAPRDGDLVESHLDACRLELLGIHVADGQGNLRHAEGPATISAVKDDIRHLAAAQRPGRLLTQHPADGIGHVGLAAAIRPDDGGDAGLEVERGLVREGLEAKNGEVLQIHARSVSPISGGV